MDNKRVFAKKSAPPPPSPPPETPEGNNNDDPFLMDFEDPFETDEPTTHPPPPPGHTTADPPPHHLTQESSDRKSAADKENADLITNNEQDRGSSEKTSNQQQQQQQGVGGTRRNQTGDPSQRTFRSHNKTWSAQATGSNSTTQAHGHAARLPLHNSNNVAGSAGAEKSAYDRLPKGKADVCLDLSSYKFIPEDDQRVDLVLQAIHGERRVKQKKTGNSTYVHNFPTVFSSEATGIEAAQGPGASPTWDETNFFSVVDFPSTYPPREGQDPLHHTAIIHHLLGSEQATQLQGEMECPELRDCGRLPQQLDLHHVQSRRPFRRCV